MPHSDVPFTEIEAWSAVGQGWRPLFASYLELGFSFEAHHFTCVEPLDWSRSFHPGGLELCLNISGTALVANARHSVEVKPHTYVFYHQGVPPLTATRLAGEAHQFITVEYSAAFLARYFRAQAENLHSLVRKLMLGETKSSDVSASERLGTSLLPLVESLRHPPVFAPAQAIWFQSKALELAAQLFFRPPEGEFLCTRAQRVARERADRVRSILRERLTEPPALEELGRLVGCSPFYLSRSFSQEVGMTILQYIRRIRMERAAELLRSGKYNVTEAALEVGYSSLSHFSSAFHETFGCCPGLYPLRTPTQKAGGEKPA